MLWWWPRHWDAYRANLSLIRIAFAVAFLLLAGCSSSEPPTSGYISRVIDGDTVDVRFGNQIERVRLIGIDTPELGFEGEPDECWAKEASLALQRSLPVGTTVQVLRDTVARDHYGRLLGYVFSENDRFINGEMAMNGHARVLSIPPNTAYQQEIAMAEQAARRSNLGLWRACESSAR